MHFFYFRSPSLRETKIDNHGMEYHKVDLNKPPEQADNKENRDVSFQYNDPVNFDEVVTQLRWSYIIQII